MPAASKHITYPKPDDVLLQSPSIKKYLRYLLFLGPGAILASLTIGQGQLIIGPQIGAWAGFSLLWLITLNLGSYIIAYVGCRFTLLSGISIMDIFAWRTRKGWINWIFIIIILIFVPMFTAAIITTLGQSLVWIFNVSHEYYLFFGIAFSLLAGTLVIIGRYRLLEFTQVIFITFLGIGAIISVILIQPNLLEMIPNYFLIGNIPSNYPSWVDQVEGFSKTPIPLIMLGYLGTLTISIVPLVGYLGWIKVKRWGIFRDTEDPDKLQQQLSERFKKEGGIRYLPTSNQEIKKSRLLLIPILVDLGIAFLVVSVISTAYITAGRYLLGPQGDGTFLLPSDINLIRQQAVIFSHIASWLTPLYQISVFFALFGTAYAGFEAASRMLFETSKHLSKRINRLPYRKFLVLLMIYILVTGIPVSILIYFGVSVVLILSLTLLFIGVVGVVIYGFGAIYMSQKVLPKDYRLKPLGLILALIGLAFMMLPLLFLLL
ncbi:MAG: Nramp family divalent metal transporter [Candidatus Thermoplasmatota archaeon]|nr:Nramp family divalent metal transporter [Candidatus Thermoplasmatota archaeon]